MDIDRAAGTPVSCECVMADGTVFEIEAELIAMPRPNPPGLEGAVSGYDD